MVGSRAGRSVGEALGVDLPATLAFDYPTVADIAGFLDVKLFGDSAGSLPPEALFDTANDGAPGSRALEMITASGFSTPSSSCDALPADVAGGDGASRAPFARWDVETPIAETDARYGVFVPHPDCFDGAAFGIGRAEASLMDPQQRLLLEACLALLASDAPGASGTRGSRAGVFVGIQATEYANLCLAANPAQGETSLASA